MFVTCFKTLHIRSISYIKINTIPDIKHQVSGPLKDCGKANWPAVAERCRLLMPIKKLMPTVDVNYWWLERSVYMIDGRYGHRMESGSLGFVECVGVKY